MNPVSPDPAVIAEAAETLSDGGVVVFPTRCLYGLGVDAFNHQAVTKIYALKQRSRSKPVLVLIADEEELKTLTADIPPAAKRLMKYFWPGRVTLVFQAGSSISSQLTCGSGKIGVRLVAHPVTAALVHAAKTPITGTSANISSNAGCSNAVELDETVAGGVDLILDAGRLAGGAGSTVVDVTSDPPQVLREGVVTSDEIKACLNPITA